MAEVVGVECVVATSSEEGPMMLGPVPLFKTTEVAESLYCGLKYDIFFDEYVIDIEKRSQDHSGVRGISMDLSKATDALQLGTQLLEAVMARGGDVDCEKKNQFGLRAVPNLQLV